MKKYNLKRFLASLLAVLMLASVTGVSPAVFADWGDSARAGIATMAAKSDEKIVLNGSEFKIRIPYKNGSMDTGALKKLVFETCVNVSASDPSGLTYDNDKLSIQQKGSKEIFYKALDKITEDETCTVRFKYAKSLASSWEATCTITFLGREVAPFSVAVPQEGVSLVFNNDASLNYAAIEDAIRALVTSSDESLAPSNITVEYRAGVGQYKQLDYNAALASNAFGEGTKNIKLTWAGNDQYKPFEWTGDINFTDNRIATNIAIKENASITYNVDKDAMKKDIFNNVIDWAASTPTDKTALTYENFKFEYKGKDLADAKLNADEKNPQDITISYSGDANSKPCNNVTASVIVKKANVKVSMNMFTKAYAGVEEDLSKEALGVTLDPDDPNLDVYKVFTGINTNLETSVNLVLTDDQQAIINKISEIQIAMGEDESETLKAKLKEGIKISEVKDAINKVLKYCDNQAAEWLLDKLGLPSLDSIKNILFVLDKMTELFDDTKVCVGLPDHAGLYKAYAIAVNKNYNTGYASGTVLILMNIKNVKIVMNENFDKKMTVETAKEVAKAPALLQQNDVTVKDQSNLHYLYTGIQSNLKPYQSTTEFPTEPGHYVVTVVTLGGDYIASPVTRSFQITK